jgi:TolA-binding protein
LKRSAIIFIIILVASAFVLSAQDFKGKGRLAGTVWDQDGKPLEDVTVKLFSPRAGGGLEVKTDKNGRWLAAWIRSGEWHVDFEKVGYAPQKKSVEISENRKNPEMEVKLEKVEGLVVTEGVQDLLTKGNELFEKNDYEGALAVYQDIIAKYPDVYIIYRNIGNCFFAQEKYEQAEESYLKLLAEDPKNVDALIAVGNCYTNRGEPDKALEWYGKVEFEKIEDPVVLYNLGTIYFGNSKFEDALKFYRKAVERNPEFTDALYQLGLAYLNLQQSPEAIAAFESYLKLDPDSPRAGTVRNFLDYLKKK